MRRLLPIIVIAAALSVGTYLGYRASRPARPAVIAEPALSVTFLDPALGGGVFAQTTEGRSLLIDPGPQAAADELIDYLKSKRVRSVWVMVTRPDADHAGALADLVSALRVEKLYRGEADGASPVLRRSLETSGKQRVARSVLAAGGVIELSPKVTVEVLGPPVGLLRDATAGTDDNSLIVRLSCGSRRMLLMSDARMAAEAYLIRSGVDLRSSVMQVPRHGRYGGTSLELLREVGAEIFVISVGRGTDRPSAAVLKRLDREYTGAEVYRTDRDGAVTVETDGSSIAVRTGGANAGR